jgi:hypothetical protein
MKGFVLIGIFLLTIWSNLQAQVDSRKAFWSPKIDLLGPGIAAASQGKYIRFSPEIEFQKTSWRSISLLVDVEVFRGRQPFAGLVNFGWWPPQDTITGDFITQEQSVRIGARKYFGANRISGQGSFVELQAGLSHTLLDSIFYVTDQRGRHFSENIFPEFRLRGGYQRLLSRHWLLSGCIEVDASRAIVGQRWNRIVIAEINLGYRL